MGLPDILIYSCIYLYIQFLKAAVNKKTAISISVDTRIDTCIAFSSNFFFVAGGIYFRTLLKLLNLNHKQQSSTDESCFHQRAKVIYIPFQLRLAEV